MCREGSSCDRLIGSSNSTGRDASWRPSTALALSATAEHGVASHNRALASMMCGSGVDDAQHPGHQIQQIEQAGDIMVAKRKTARGIAAQRAFERVDEAQQSASMQAGKALQRIGDDAGKYGKKSPEHDKRAGCYRHQADAREDRIHAVPPCAGPAPSGKAAIAACCASVLASTLPSVIIPGVACLSHRAPRLLATHPVAISAVAARVRHSPRSSPRSARARQQGAPQPR